MVADHLRPRPLRRGGHHDLEDITGDKRPATQLQNVERVAVITPVARHFPRVFGNKVSQNQIVVTVLSFCSIYSKVQV